MDPLEIVSASVWVVAPDVERLICRSDMEGLFETVTIVQITTRDGETGIGGSTLFSENNFDASLGESLKTILPAAIGRSASDPPKVTNSLMKCYTSMAPKPQAVIDIAMWDRLAKHHEKPLHQFLGSNRDTMPAYASLPLFDTTKVYVNFIQLLVDTQGFDAFKLHIWCDIRKDIELIDTIRDAYGDTNLKFIVDLEERYTLDDAINMAKLLEKINCLFLEAPLPDTDLEGYQTLRKNTDVPILPAGNTLETLGLIKMGIKANAWDALRVDATYAGGISMTKKIMDFGNSHNMSTELQAWGHSLSQAANLHLSLASNRTAWFELPVPYEPHEAGVINPIRARDGLVIAPAGSGLGIKLDWDKINRHLLAHYQINAG